MSSTHTFHIPVLGTGYSADTPIRVAHFGISSVISLVDDYLLEKLRRHYAETYELPYVPIPGSEDDGRARRITAYLDLVGDVVRINMERVRALPFFEKNDKTKYFEMLPSKSEVRQYYDKFLAMEPGAERDKAAETLTQMMSPGSIDVNIMVKLDPGATDKEGVPVVDGLSDAKAALRGYAESALESGLVLSAGINQSLYSYMARFRDFYRDASGSMKKKIILKVSDLRSALIQEKFLARKGLEVSEFRIESGLNCGGHAFETEGRLLPVLLHEFSERRHEFGRQFRSIIKTAYEKMGWTYPDETVVEKHDIRLTVQGGIGTSGEDARMREYFGADGTGWASPFMLVPEAICIDENTRKMLSEAGTEDLYLSEASPLGVLFNNLRLCGAQLWMQARAAMGKPGSPCLKGLARLNPEFGKPMCVASAEYQELKFAQLAELPEEEAAEERRKLEAKECICHQLGNSALIRLGMVRSDNSPVAVCPGPNLAWFNRDYTLQEMVDHIYGRGDSLVPKDRPHMFVQEIALNAKLLAKRIESCACERDATRLQAYRENLESGMTFCVKVAVETTPYPDENLASVLPAVERIRKTLASYYVMLDKWLSGAGKPVSEG